MRYILILLLLCIGCSDRAHEAGAPKQLLTHHIFIAHLAEELTERTPVEVSSPADDYTTIETLAEELRTKKEWIAGKAPHSDAVITLARLIPEDQLFTHVRRHNLHAVEIDISRSYYEGAPSPAVLRDTAGSANPYIWLSPQNILAMAYTLQRDLKRLYPAYAETISQNFQSFRQEMRALQRTFGTKYAQLARFETALMDPAYAYLAEDINLFITHRFPHESDWDSADSSRFITGLTAGEFSLVMHRWNPGGTIDSLCTAHGVSLITPPLGVPAAEGFQNGIIPFYEHLYKSVYTGLKGQTQ
ncbi:metal ABC transporter solute-binding protein, Zn/Mn family [Chitinivibrio alkaliphilus]|uniref:ABC-type metal ion transport system, periplasmic component/surface adhesin n=1 Tax=Chitinivibrio alkaliphilus ACht1 TaxID=1313304 RepID=U7DBH9_9BACT|nr:zinc ABC transporter substrate-binding protein [Chitinivibrio alkaliphilus]ERP38918.1 ABC-type metal ion transport system, periplasmic component/surface adhesin [Chitinivibrio alkaliphilus ACht1]